MAARPQRGRRADDRDDRQHLGRMRKQHGVPPDQIHARGHHRRRVNERRDRSGAFHRVGQPDVERNLRGLAGRADEQQQGDRGHDTEGRLGGQPGNRGVQVLEIDGAELRERKQHAEDERDVADAVDDERLLAGIRGKPVLVPEADEQVRAKPHAFPADEQHHEVVAQHEQQHERREEVQVRKVARVFVRLLFDHVRRRIDDESGSRFR